MRTRPPIRRLAALVAPALRAQAPTGPTGRIVGTVSDSAAAQPLANATVLVIGTRFGAQSGTDGRYSIGGVPAGEQQVRVQLAEALQGVVSQLLLPTKDKKGRVAAFEIMVATVAIRNLIREGKTHQMPSSIQTGTQLGMQSLEQALRNLVMQGRIDRAHAEGVLQSSSSSSTLGPAPTPGAPAAAPR